MTLNGNFVGVGRQQQRGLDSSGNLIINQQSSVRFLRGWHSILSIVVLAGVFLVYNLSGLIFNFSSLTTTRIFTTTSSSPIKSTDFLVNRISSFIGKIQEPSVYPPLYEKTVSPTDLPIDQEKIVQPIQNENEVKVIPVDERPKPTIYRRIGGGWGRQCNQLLILSTAIELADRDNFVLIADLNDFPVLAKVDVDLLEQTYKDNLILRKHGNPRLTDFNISEGLVQPTTYWCGLKMKMDVIRRGIRPRAEYIKEAERSVKEMRQIIGPNADLMSVHIRHYDGLCANLLPDICEHRSDYEFRPEPFGCNQTLTQEYLDWVKSDWPDHNWKGRDLNIYMSTDRQVESIDRSYVEHYKQFGIARVFDPDVPHTESKRFKNEYKRSTDMLTDMWIGVLTDFHVAMLRSSCDKIVSEWRGVIRASDRIDTVHPRSCLGAYYYTPPHSKHDYCPHTKFLALDTSMLDSPYKSYCAACELILALAVTLSKAQNQGMQQIHIYNEHGDFIKETIDYLNVEKLLGIPILFRHTPEALLYDRKQIYNSGKFRGSAIRALNQVKCAKGATLKHLVGKTIVPHEDIRAEAKIVNQKVPHLSESTYKGDSFCSRSGCDQQSQSTAADISNRDSIPSSAIDIIRELWERVLSDEYLFEPKSPCSQLIALWRYSIGQSNGNECCFQNYGKQPEPAKLSSIQREVYWDCP